MKYFLSYFKDCWLFCLPVTSTHFNFGKHFANKSCWHKLATNCSYCNISLRAPSSSCLCGHFPFPF